MSHLRKNLALVRKLGVIILLATELVVIEDLGLSRPFYYVARSAATKSAHRRCRVTESWLRLGYGWTPTAMNLLVSLYACSRAKARSPPLASLCPSCWPDSMLAMATVDHIVLLYLLQRMCLDLDCL